MLKLATPSTPHPIDPDDARKPVDHKTARPAADEPCYEVRAGKLYRVDSTQEALIANFSLRVIAEHVHKDEDLPLRRDYLLEVLLNSEKIAILIPAEDFCTGRLLPHIAAGVGAKAIVYAGHKELRIAAQELAPDPVPLETVSTSMGFTDHDSYLAPGMEISAQGIDLAPGLRLDLSQANFARHLGFIPPNVQLVKGLLGHLHREFLQLKSHAVMYPLMGHIVLAAFASHIGSLGSQKPVLHLQGLSGSGKTFLGNLAASFYGLFNDRPLPWTSTANAIEMEGFYFRDALFFIDDYKQSIVEPEKITRIIQNQANCQGRARLRSGGDYKIAPMRGVRGLILSTGEDFVSDVESVTGRTILIHVEPDQNLEAGAVCWRRKADYRMLMPAILQWLLAQPDWKEQLAVKLGDTTEALRGQVAHLSNGTRLAANWALNAFGFETFVQFSVQAGGIAESEGADMLSDYKKIVAELLRSHAELLQVQEPGEVFFQVLSQMFATGSARVAGLGGQSGGKLIGKLRDNGNIVCLFPDPTLAVFNTHFKSLGRRLPFTKDTLREALTRRGFLIRSGPGRVAHQVRVDGNRLQAWQFEAEQFKACCGVAAE